MDRWLEEWAQEAIEIEDVKKANSSLLILAASIITCLLYTSDAADEE